MFRDRNPKKTQKIKQGTIRIDGRGLGKIEITGAPLPIEIETAFLNTALNGDEVDFRLLAKKKGVQYGEVSRIIERKRMRFVGVLEEEKGVFFVTPDDRRFYIDIVIPVKEKNNAKSGEKVLMEITEWSDPKREPLGKILKVLGQPGLHEVEMETIVLEKGFDLTFDGQILKEAQKIKDNFATDIKNEIPLRRDFRQALTCTIDPVDAKDYDDALSFRELPGGFYEVGVHIADVSHYVRPGTTLDTEAIKRATSIYLVDRTIPMLPEVLSNGVCSLVEAEDRLTFSAVFTIDIDGNIKDQWFGRTVINSNKRFSYEQVQEILDLPANTQALFKKELDTLNEIAYALRKKKIEEGAIVFEDEEVKFELDAEMRPIGVVRKVRTDSHKLIEDFMLLANKKVAEYVSQINKNQEKTFVYRVHDVPDREKLVALSDFLRPLGYKLKVKTGSAQRELNALLEQAAGQPEESMIARAAIRSMSKAVYSVKNIGHYGLAFAHYTHFTSPIRRYPDMMVHRLLAIYLKKQKPKKEMLDEYAELVIHCSEQEKMAAEAERDSVKYKQVEYMGGHIGETYEGIISGVTEWGIFVEERETKSEGLVRVRDLEDDYYNLDEKNFCLVGQKTKKKYRLGDLVKFKITKADPKTKTLDFKLV